jgi:hypothetical protein
MNKLTKIFTLILAVFMIVSCEDDMTPKISGVQIENNDLIQVNDVNPNVTLYFSAQASDLKSVEVSVAPAAGGAAIYSNKLDKITNDKLNRVKVNVPFPTPDIAPSGTYVATFKINGSKETSYNIQILNNRSIKYCDFPAVPAGKVGIFVSVPGGDDVTAAGKDIYIVGDFMDENGAAGDWNPGNPDFKLTKLSEQCYYIYLDVFPTGANFKLTLGDWPLEFLGASGQGLDNQVHSGGSTVNFIAYNFKTLPVTTYAVPEVLPNEAIQSGRTTVIADVGTVSTTSTYYLVEKGATTLDGAIAMTRVVGTTKFAGAVPREAGAEYIIVKDEITKIAIGAFGSQRTAVIDETTNPLTVMKAAGFTTEFTPVVVSNLFLVGGATPGGWNNPVPDPAQKFANNGNGVFTLTIALAANDGYLMLLQNGSWDFKIGKNGGPLSGNLVYGGSDFTSPSEAGTYTITADLNNESYTLVKQ